MSNDETQQSNKSKRKILSTLRASQTNPREELYLNVCRILLSFEKEMNVGSCTSASMNTTTFFHRYCQVCIVDG